MIPLHLLLLQRYAPDAPIDIFLATEVPDHPVCQEAKREFGVKLIPLEQKEAGFLDSRAAALRRLTAFGEYRYVLPMQEDFLIDRRPDLEALEDAKKILDESNYVASVRLMPSPGPGGPAYKGFARITPETDHYGFTFQATLWRLEPCLAWYETVTRELEKAWPAATTRPEKRIAVETRYNFAENPDGQKIFWKLFSDRGEIHVGWKRAGQWRNAVYLSPWPYRPTAIIQGKVEPWAEELAEREGCHL